MSTEEDSLSRDEDGQPQAPLLVLPGAGATTTQGLGSGGGAMTGSPILPPPVVSSGEVSPASDNLADHIERTLAEDGRFLGQMSGLSVTADDDGHVTVSGSLQNPALRPSLLATIRTVPGVTQLKDETR